MQYTVTFTHAGQEWEAKVVALPQTIEFDLEETLQQNGPGRTGSGIAKLLVLREGLKSLYRGSGSLKRPQNLRDSKGVLQLPDARDEETHVGIKEPLIKAVVLHNDFLCHVDPFKDVFESYAPTEGDGIENPTETTATSQIGSVSSLPSPQTQVPTETPDATSGAS